MSNLTGYAPGSDTDLEYCATKDSPSGDIPPKDDWKAIYTPADNEARENQLPDLRVAYVEAEAGFLLNLEKLYDVDQELIKDHADIPSMITKLREKHYVIHISDKQ